MFPPLCGKLNEILKSLCWALFKLNIMDTHIKARFDESNKDEVYLKSITMIPTSCVKLV